MKPYETVQELLEDSKIHGPYVTRRDGHFLSITSIHPIPGICIGVVLDGRHNSPLRVEELAEYYTWQDGHPCGKNES